MTAQGPLELVVRTATMLEELGIPYVLGGSLAATFFGEPRSTMDIDVAIDVHGDSGEDLLRRAAVEFVVPVESARHAVRTHGSFNLLSTEGGMKIDLFVLGDALDVDDLRSTARHIGLSELLESALYEADGAR